MNINQPNFDFATIVYYQISHKYLARTSDKHLAVIERVPIFVLLRPHIIKSIAHSSPLYNVLVHTHEMILRS